MLKSKSTVVIGASINPERYSNKAVNKLLEYNHTVYALGLKEGVIKNININTSLPLLKGIDTVTLYINPTNQTDWYDYVLSLKPKRVIFNPGTENKTFENLLHQNNIETIEACTLVLLATHQY